MNKYKLSEIFEAKQYTGNDSVLCFLHWGEGKILAKQKHNSHHVNLEVNGDCVESGDWIIHQMNCFFKNSDKDFKLTYEKVEDE